MLHGLGPRGSPEQTTLGTKDSLMIDRPGYTVPQWLTSYALLRRENNTQA